MVTISRTTGRLLTLAALTAVGLAGMLPASQARPAGTADRATATATEPVAVIRVDQVGYPVSGPKAATVMLARAIDRVTFTIRGDHGQVFAGTSGPSLGRWNAGYPAVYRLDFSALRHIGSYEIDVAGPEPVRSPRFMIAPAADLYDRLVRNGVRYFASERDGNRVDPGVLSRQPANLTDSQAHVYAAPTYDDNDELTGGLQQIGGPVDVAGGWFDAGGGYEKYGFTAAYTDALMSVAARQSIDNGTALTHEAQHGLRWLTHLWDPVTKTAYMQVGIGNGGHGIAGDHDFWFLPQQEDQLNAKPGDANFYVKYRPVFAAAAPGAPISPDLAGRYAAAFALGAQLDATRDVGAARRLLYLARTVYAQAQTTNVTSILTAYPHDFYPGTQWRSDMLWGATEIALADAALNVDARMTHTDLTAAGGWARAYLAQGHPAGGDTLNLYDDGAVAEADLLRAQRTIGGQPTIAPAKLLADMAAQLRIGQQEATGDPFDLGFRIGQGDVSPHAFGLFVTEVLYRHYGGDGSYTAFAQHQMDYALGANPWGTTFVVGAGTTFPHCMQSEIANLSGSLTGTGDIQLGAVGDGPHSPDVFEGLGTVEGMRTCGVDGYRAFDSSTAEYEDNVIAYPSVEPADDYTMTATLAFSLAADSRR